MGVKVAVQVMPSLELTGVNVPLLTVRSLLSKLVTASLKVMVTVAVSPAISAVSERTMLLTVGATVSTATLWSIWVALVPAALVALARMCLVPSLLKLLPATVADQEPSASTLACTMLPSTKVRSTVLPDCILLAVPLMSTVPAFSAALTLSSAVMLATVITTGVVLMVSSLWLMSVLVMPPAVTLTSTS